MPYSALISIFSPDQMGLVTAVAGRLFDLGANMGDTNFAVLGEGAELTSICELPDDLAADAVSDELKSLPALRDGRVAVRPFELATHHGPEGRITHVVQFEGRDQPGLVARLSEVFQDFDANIVRMNTERTPGTEGDHHTARFDVYIPGRRADACLAALGNTAGWMGQTFRWETVPAGDGQ